MVENNYFLLHWQAPFLHRNNTKRMQTGAATSGNGVRTSSVKYLLQDIGNVFSQLFIADNGQKKHKQCHDRKIQQKVSLFEKPYFIDKRVSESIHQIGDGIEKHNSLYPNITYLCSIPEYSGKPEQGCYKGFYKVCKILADRGKQG